MFKAGFAPDKMGMSVDQMKERGLLSTSITDLMNQQGSLTGLLGQTMGLEKTMLADYVNSTYFERSKGRGGMQSVSQTGATADLLRQTAVNGKVSTVNESAVKQAIKDKMPAQQPLIITEPATGQSMPQKGSGTGKDTIVLNSGRTLNDIRHGTQFP